jgi:serine/arginine repetitive matrix protein 2
VEQTSFSPRSSEATVRSPGLLASDKLKDASNGLETVPLDQQEESDYQKREFKYSAPWKKGSSPLYSAIPTRKSSRNRVLGPKTSGTSSSQKLSPRNTGSRQRSYERLASRSKGLRSISSAGSLESSGADAKAQEGDNLSNNNTVHWLKELLSNDTPYQSRLTALPPRTRRGENKSTGRVRSQTAPVKPITELFLGATPKPGEDLDISKSEAEKFAPKAFTRTINDLEKLLNEALIIARQAADRKDAAKMPGILDDAARMLKGQRKFLSEESLLGGVGRDRARSRALAKRGSDEISSVPSVHESLRSYSG